MQNAIDSSQNPCPVHSTRSLSEYEQRETFITLAVCLFQVLSNVINAIQPYKTVLRYLRAWILRNDVEDKQTAQIIHQKESISVHNTIDSIRQLKRVKRFAVQNVCKIIR